MIRSLLLAGTIITLNVYLFITAPPELPESEQRREASIPVQRLFEIVAQENATARALYTKEIVTAGERAGLAFSEHWRSEGVHAGPLPALFLREVATSLEKSPVRLALFLGSDQPIRTSNRFSGAQLTAFEKLRATGEPQFFFSDDVKLHVAMFPDVAVAPGCVSCHNEHPDSPKNDWKLNEIMGATTWTYPHAEVSLGELLQVVAEVRKGFATAYTSYIDKTRGFPKPPAIGDEWPRAGYALPSPAVFLATIDGTSSPVTLASLLHMQAEVQP